MTLKNIFKKSHFLRSWHRTYLAVKAAYGRARFVYGVDDDVDSHKLRDKYVFDDRSTGSGSVLLILAGYKQQLWNDVFGRVAKFTPKDIDICVIATGREVPELKQLCEKNGWSYLSTGRNCLTLSQNIAINLHPKAEWIYKIDEDVFLTDGVFEKMRGAYDAATSSRCEVGMVAPLLNVNGYCYVRILEKLGRVGEWEKKFGPLFYTEGLYDHKNILKDPEASRFMWQLGSIDELNAKFSSEGESYTISPYRFSIGTILFKRDLWKGMGMFSVSVQGNDLGVDEEQLCIYCLLHTKAKVVCENALVGHLAFGPQTKEMLKFHAEGKCR